MRKTIVPFFVGAVLILLGLYLANDSGLLFHDYQCVGGFACGNKYETVLRPEFWSGITVVCIGVASIILGSVWSWKHPQHL
jgi:hypothetical protein